MMILAALFILIIFLSGIILMIIGMKNSPRLFEIGSIVTGVCSFVTAGYLIAFTHFVTSTEEKSEEKVEEKIEWRYEPEVSSNYDITDYKYQIFNTDTQTILLTNDYDFQ